MTDLTLFQGLKLLLTGKTYIGHRRRPSWRGSLPFYAFRCPVHGIVENYPHGFKKRLECPKCINPNILWHKGEER